MKVSAPLYKAARPQVADELAAVLPPRPADAHKGLFGHVLVVGGNHGMAGAARLAGEAVLRSGAGRVTLATRPEHAALITAARPELMAAGVSGASELAPLLARATCCVVGPGLGQDAWAAGLLEAVLAAGLPTVLDADALNLLAVKPLPLPAAAILTPHPGEAGRLLGCDATAIQADRLAAVQQLAARYRTVAVLKGAGTLVAGPDEEPTVCPYGNPGMATAGMGDVLAGLIGALLAQGLAPVAAARAGVLAHALAGDLAAGSQPRGLLAGDVLARLRAVLNPVEPA